MSQTKALPAWALAAGGLVLFNLGIAVGWAMARHAAAKDAARAATAPALR